MFCSFQSGFWDNYSADTCPTYLHDNPSRPNPGRREKIKLNFYFHTFLWYLKRFYEGLYKTF